MLPLMVLIAFTASCFGFLSWSVTGFLAAFWIVAIMIFGDK